MILLAAGLFCGACAEDSGRLAIDFSQKVDVQPKTTPPPGAALNVAVAYMISPNETIIALSREQFHPGLEESLRDHIYACLGKPADPDELLYVLKGIFA